MEFRGPCALCYHETINNDISAKELHPNNLAFRPGLEYLCKKYKVGVPEYLCLRCIQSTFRHKCHYDNNILSQTRTYFCKHCEHFLCDDCPVEIQRNKDTRRIINTYTGLHHINPGDFLCRACFRQQVINNAPYHRQMDLGNWRRTYFALALNCPQPVINALSDHWPSSNELTHLEGTLQPPYWSETLQQWVS